MSYFMIRIRTHKMGNNDWIARELCDVWIHWRVMIMPRFVGNLVASTSQSGSAID